MNTYKPYHDRTKKEDYAKLRQMLHDSIQNHDDEVTSAVGFALGVIGNHYPDLMAEWEAEHK